MLQSIYNMFTSPQPSYRENPLTQFEALEKMIRNAQKAIKEQSTGTIPLPSIETLQRKEITPLKLAPTIADHIGPRPTMEDAHCFLKLEEGTLIGVFDGHGGNEVSALANERFQQRFSEVLKAQNGDVFRTFEVLIHEIHEEVKQNPEWNKIGSTAVVSFIDKQTHQIITATLGDSEANLYRDNTSISLSPVRDWTSKKDEERLIRAHGDKVNQWKKILAARGYRGEEAKKGIRSRLREGVNVSRAIGDVSETGTIDEPLVSHKPKITINKLQKGDVLVLACDGLKDYVPEQEIINIVAARNAWTIGNVAKWSFNWILTNVFWFQPRGLANELVNHAIYTRMSRDNVTVVAVEVT